MNTENRVRELISQETVWRALEKVWDPYLGQNLRESGQIKAIDCGERIAIELKYPGAGYKNELTSLIHQALATEIAAVRGLDLNISEVKLARESASDSETELAISITWKIQSGSPQNDLKNLKGVKNLLAVASGKGGVGKSTTAVNLALALQAEGAAVGILDADIYGPSQPRMLGIQTENGLSNKPDVNAHKQFIPVKAWGLPSMSMGYLVEESAAMIWRGPMVSQALQQMVFHTEWGELDYLIVDLPPGTGDIQLTLAQKIPVSGAVIVTTPQDIALQDAKKAVTMFRKLNIPVLGVIENMSLHICSHCGQVDPIFGEAGGEKLAEEFSVDLLGKLPLDRSIRELTDQGRPSVATDKDSEIAKLYREIARKAAGKLASLLSSKNEKKHIDIALTV